MKSYVCVCVCETAVDDRETTRQDTETHLPNEVDKHAQLRRRLRHSFCFVYKSFCVYPKGRATASLAFRALTVANPDTTPFPSLLAVNRQMATVFVTSKLTRLASKSDNIDSEIPKRGQNSLSMNDNLPDVSKTPGDDVI